MCYIDAQQNKILHLESVLEVVRLNICRSCLRTLLRENLFWPNVNISRERLSLVWHQGWRQVYKTAANHNRREIYVDGSEKYRKIRNHMILCLYIVFFIGLHPAFKKSLCSWQTVSSLGLTCLEQYGLGSTFLHRHKS